MNNEMQHLKQDIVNTFRTAVEAAADQSPRKPGGQPGNQNARRHGFYARNPTPEQQDALEEARDAENLAKELAFLRVKIADMVADPTVNPDQVLRALWVLARMVRIDDRVRFGP